MKIDRSWAAAKVTALVSLQQFGLATAAAQPDGHCFAQLAVEREMALDPTSYISHDD